MSSGRQNNDGAPKHSAPVNGEVNDESSAADRLDQVLDLTLKSVAGEALDPADLAAFRDVARNRQGQPFSYDPVAVELVFAALCRQFEPHGEQKPALRNAAEQIAAALCDDPEARVHLEQLWGRLSGVPQ